MPVFPPTRNEGDAITARSAPRTASSSSAAMLVPSASTPGRQCLAHAVLAGLKCEGRSVSRPVDDIDLGFYVAIRMEELVKPAESRSELELRELAP